MNETRATTMASRILRVAGIRALEAAVRQRQPTVDLMDRAGHAVATMAITMAADRAGPILVLVGPGNNGGDALVAAGALRRRGIEVGVALLGEASAFRGDARHAWDRWVAIDGMHDGGDAIDVVEHASLVVDGLFGIGLRPDRPLAGRAAAWIARVNACTAPVLAIDVPSGIDADTGEPCGVAIDADRTLTFLARKPGLMTGQGLDRCGDVLVDLLGLDRDDAATRDLAFADGDDGTVVRPALFGDAWRPRRLDTHKGSYGSVAVVGGNAGMVGAALLAARMALHAGAGRVYVRLLATDAPTHDPAQPELMLRASLDGVAATAFAVGPGLGHDDLAIAALHGVLATDQALVVDADGLNAVAGHGALLALLHDRRVRGRPAAVLTPHPLEAARLLGVDVRDVQADRIAAARRLADRTASVVVLKGAGSIVAAPGGAWYINPTGNPALATGGTGDVLCGLVAALLAQKMPPLEAALAATWAHGAAADELVAAGVGPIGLAASELIPAIRRVLNRLASRAA